MLSFFRGKARGFLSFLVSLVNQRLIVGLSAANAEVAEWQTRYVQGVVSVRTCGFKSHLRHHIVRL